MNREHAIVIGGSIAGMVTARVLADHFQKVTILERDQVLADHPHARPGVPQSKHLHALLLRGLQIFEQLFPGIEQDLDSAGVETIVPGKDFHIMYASGWAPQKSTAVHMRPCTRPFLENAIRRRLTKHQNIRILERCWTTGLVPGRENRSVQGIVATNDSCGIAKIRHADLIVDASGRSSRSGRWLEGLGYGTVPQTVVDAHWGYAARLYEKPADFEANWKGLLVLNRPPDMPRVGVLLPMEGNRWLLNLAGVMRDYPPRDEAEFLDYAASLRSGLIYAAIKNARPISAIFQFQHTANIRRHFEKLSNWPDRFLVLGDALCAFNPVYGQGMSVCAIEALALGEALRNNMPANGFAQQMQRKFAEIVDGPWTLATSEDLRWPGTEGATPGAGQRFLHWYVDRVIQAIPSSPHVYDVFQQVNHMVRSPQALFSPKVLWRVLKNKQPRTAHEQSGESGPAIWEFAERNL